MAQKTTRKPKKPWAKGRSSPQLNRCGRREPYLTVTLDTVIVSNF